MAEEMEFPKIDGDPSYASEYNNFRNANLLMVQAMNFRTAKATGYVYWDTGKIRVGNKVYDITGSNSGASQTDKLILAVLNAGASTATISFQDSDYTFSTTDDEVVLGYVDSDSRLYSIGGSNLERTTGMVLIEKKTMSASTQYFDFDALNLESDGTYVLELNGINASGAYPQQWRFYLNADTTNGNYREYKLKTVGTTVSGSTASCSRTIEVAESGYGYGLFYITKTIDNKCSITGNAFCKTSAGTEFTEMGQFTVIWTSTANVTRMRIGDPVAGRNWNTGSTAKLYRLVE